MRTPIILPAFQAEPETEQALQHIAIEGPDASISPLDDSPVDDITTALHHIETPRTEPQPYERFMRNERPIRLGDMAVDEQTGWRYQMWDIGLTRNSTERRPMKVFMEPIPHVILDQHVPLRGWYKGKFEPPGVRNRPCFTDSILTSVYGGYCSIGCNFCYVNSGPRGYRGQGVTTVDPAYPDKIARQLRHMRTGAAVYMCSFIDPFLELEQYYHNTQRTAEAAIKEGLPIYFLTRKQPPDWAFDLLRRNQFSYCQFSINTSSPRDWQLLSPRAVSLETMYANVEAMSHAGIYVSVQVNPIIAGVTTNADIVQLIGDLAAQGAKTLIFKFVEISYSNAASLVRQVRARFRERTDALAALFTQNIGGVKTIDEDYRLNALDLFAAECKKAGVDMSVCYEYRYERDAQGKVLSKTGVSVGPKYVTSACCHGHRVPVHSRATTDVPFHPIKECPPSGCLYCADQFGGEQAVPCGNELLARAPAWDPVMLNEPADVRDGATPVKLLSRLKVLGSVTDGGGCCSL